MLVVMLSSVVFIATPVHAQGTQRLSTEDLAAQRIPFVIGQTQEVIRVDGVLEESVWQTAQPIPLPYETNPGYNIPARIETVCRITYDQNHLYYGCHATEPNPASIRSFITDRDNLFSQDNIGFVVDPFNDARRGFVFTVNALGVQMDGIMDPRQNESFSTAWDAIWESAGRITEDGYQIEVAIPFKSLRFPETDAVQTWGFWFWRNQPRSESIVYLSRKVDNNNSCDICLANLMTGLQGFSPGRNVELIPTVTARRIDRRTVFPDGRLEVGTPDAELGLDARWNVTTDLAWNATLNPDFSQVEADVAQLDVNTRFALRFPEKRPFFLEGAEFFQTPLEAVFTRSIADPSFGTKLTGKLGRHTVGALIARDDVTNVLFPGSQQSTSTFLEAPVTTLLGRYRHDVGKSSTVGVLYTGREGEEGYYNRVIGADGVFQFGGPFSARLQYLHAETQYPEHVATENNQHARAFSGDSFIGELEFSTRNWGVDVEYEDLADDFRADAGFMAQVGTRTFKLNVTRRVWAKPNAWFTQLRFWNAYWRSEDRHGNEVDSYRVLSAQYTGPWQSEIGFFARWKNQFFGGRPFNNMFRPVLNGEIRPNGHVTLSMSSVWGDAVDFANVRSAKVLQLSPELEWRLGRQVDLQMEHTYSRLRTNGQNIFTANLTQLRAVYNFNIRMLVRVIVQYRHTRRNVSLYTNEVDRVSESVFSQLLFSYKLNPQSVVFVGYSDNYVGSTSFTEEIVDLTQADRAVFFKLGYAWRP